jgi:hypothetical protein
LGRNIVRDLFLVVNKPAFLEMLNEKR